MATPTILIGIGSSGKYVLEHVQKFHYEAFKTNKPDKVEYLFIETEKENRVGITPLENEIRRVYISLEDMGKMCENIRKEGAKWLPPIEDILNPTFGAGGRRPVGRVGLWGKNNKGNNFRNVVDAINHAYQNVAKDDNVPAVFITGTLVGGTGSGIFIDMAYIVRYLINKITEVYGLFLIPGLPSDINEKAQYYANTYASFVDLEKFNSNDYNYKEKWPTLTEPKEFKGGPYKLAQFISQDYLDGSPAIRDLNGLFKLAGLYLFLNIAGIKEQRTARLGDGDPGFYGTFGLSAIQYPKDQIEEYIACSLGIELLNRWTDPKQYIVNDQAIPINPGHIARQSSEKWDEIILNAFESLNTLGGEGGMDLVTELEQHAIKVNKKDISEEPEDYLNKLYSSNVSDQFYGRVKSNLQTAVNEIIDQLYELNVQVLEKSENLRFAHTVLEKMIDSIDNTIKYWKSIGISENANLWNNLLRDQCNWMLRKRYKSILEQDNVLKDRLITTFDLMKMHLMLPKLEEIIQYIRKDDQVDYRSSVRGNSLPRLRHIEVLINDLNIVTGSEDSKEMSLKRRIEEIISDLDDQTIPILRIYNTGSYKKDFEGGKELFEQKTLSKSRTKNDVISKPLWAFLTNQGSLFYTVLYERILRAYREKIRDYECVPDYDVGNYVIQHSDEAIQVAKKGLSGFISLNKTLTHLHYMPRFIVASADSTISKIIELFNKKDITVNFSDDPNGRKEIRDLNNIVVFYDEKTNFNLLTDLSYIEDMKQVYMRKPSNVEGTNETWINYRNAYLKVDD